MIGEQDRECLAQLGDAKKVTGKVDFSGKDSERGISFKRNRTVVLKKHDDGTGIFRRRFSFEAGMF